jgi:hypothetical protein
MIKTNYVLLNYYHREKPERLEEKVQYDIQNLPAASISMVWEAGVSLKVELLKVRGYELKFKQLDVLLLK